jgi:hypothetical protein
MCWVVVSVVVLAALHPATAATPKTLCATLGDDQPPSLLDQDIFGFTGTYDETHGVMARGRGSLADATGDAAAARGGKALWNSYPRRRARAWDGNGRGRWVFGPCAPYILTAHVSVFA